MTSLAMFRVRLRQCKSCVRVTLRQCHLQKCVIVPYLFTWFFFGKDDSIFEVLVCFSLDLIFAGHAFGFWLCRKRERRARKALIGFGKTREQKEKRKRKKNPPFASWKMVLRFERKKNMKNALLRRMVVRTGQFAHIM